MIYLLDSNAFMEAARLYYGFDMVPSFWAWLEDPSLSGRVASVRAVRDEILDGREGDLVDWSRQLPPEFWIADSADSVRNIALLSEWANDSDRTYGQAAVDEFMRSADLRLIAVAMSEGGVVATRESPAPRSKKKIKIPDACEAFNVPCISPFDTYRALGMRLT